MGIGPLQELGKGGLYATPWPGPSSASFLPEHGLTDVRFRIDHMDSTISGTGSRGRIKSSFDRISSSPEVIASAAALNV